MRTNHKYSWIDRYTTELFLEKSLIEANELSNECHVRICYLSFLLDVVEAFIVCHLPTVDQIGKAYGCTPGNTLYAMDINLSFILSCLFNKVNSIIEDAFYVFPNMVLQMVLLVSQFSLEIVRTVVSRTVDNVGNPIFTQQIFILRNYVTPQIKEVLDHFRANLFIEFVLVFFP
jgi:hypothetical protein